MNRLLDAAFDDDDPGPCPAEVLDYVRDPDDYDFEPRNGKPRGKQDREPAAVSALVSIAQENAAEFWHDRDKTAYATIENGGHQEHYPVDSPTFRGWLRGLYWATSNKGVSAQSLQDAISTLEAKALFGGAEHPVHRRVAGLDGNLYIDLADDQWRAVMVTPTGWHVIEKPPVRFVRWLGMKSLPAPTHGGNADALRHYLNVADDRAWLSMQGWLVAALSPSGPYPVLQLAGEQGTGKSTACRLLRSLIDPNEAPIRAEPRDVRDLMITARNGWVVCFDNLSKMPVWLSDALCRLSTGGGFATRRLYSDAEEALFDAQRPVVLNGIAEVASRPDLIDRCVTVTLEPIPDTQRRTERELWEQFDRDRPAILGGLLDLVATGLRRRDQVRPNRLPRMADFATWATAALGDRFLSAYEASREEAVLHAVDADPVAGAILALAERGDWSGTANELLADLAGLAGETATRQRDWPSRPNSLSARLRRIAPALRQLGVVVEFSRLSGGGRTRLVTVRSIGKSSSRIVPDRPTPPPEGPGTVPDRPGIVPCEHRKGSQETAPNGSRDDRDDVGRSFPGVGDGSSRDRPSLGKTSSRDRPGSSRIVPSPEPDIVDWV